MPHKTVLITGASGGIGRKVRAHFAGLGWVLRLVDRRADKDVVKADLSTYDEAWARYFAGVDAILHLAANSDPCAGWEVVYKDNWLSTKNVFHAAFQYGAQRLIFASSNWVMAGYRDGTERLTAELPPRPINLYGVSKLYGEELGRVYASNGLSFIAFRIGWCQARRGNQPGAHMGSRWDQLKWLSDRDLCHAMERAVLQENIDFAVLNMVSANPGMRWDIEEATRKIAYKPKDGAAAIVTPRVCITECLEYIRRRAGSSSK
jgi:nucleoside-diphosphate-sugar epimerase